MDLSRFPRRRYSQMPSPIEFLPNFTKALGGPRVWIKRDDMLGLAPGGNKTRKLEFLMGDALAQVAAFGWAVEVLALYFALGLNSLGQHARPVAEALLSGTTGAARRRKSNTMPPVSLIADMRPPCHPTRFD